MTTPWPKRSAGGSIVVKHPINLGQGAALQTGLEFALAQPGAEYFVTFDSDGQHRVEDALAMVERLRHRAAGHRRRLALPGCTNQRRGGEEVHPPSGRLSSSGLSTGVKLTDASNGLRALNRTAATRIRITQNRMAHASEIVAQIGSAKLRYAEQPVQIIYSDYSQVQGPVDVELREHPQRTVHQVGQMDSQFAIKIILIALFVVFGIALVLPATGARRLAIRRVLLLLTTLAGIVAIAFPQIVNDLANLLGVGRGTDLILYVLVVVFIGTSISNSIRHRHLEREVTKLARRVALDAAPPPPARPRAGAIGRRTTRGHGAVRVLLTGGAGYIGAHVGSRLLEARGDKVVVVDDLTTGTAEKVGANLAALRLRHLDDAGAADSVAGRHHAGARGEGAGSCTSPPPRRGGSRPCEARVVLPAEHGRPRERALEAMQRANVQSLVFSSSAAVYGLRLTGSDEPIRESDVKNPINPYEESELAGEWLVQACGEGRGYQLLVSLLRYFNVAGAGSDELADLLRPEPRADDLRAKSLAEDKAPLGVRRRLPDSGWHVRARLRARRRPGGRACRDAGASFETAEPGHVIVNVGTGTGFSVREMVDAISRTAGVDLPPVIRERRAGDPASVVADPTAIRALTGWSRATSASMTSSSPRGHRTSSSGDGGQSRESAARGRHARARIGTVGGSPRASTPHRSRVVPAIPPTLDHA